MEKIKEIICPTCRKNLMYLKSDFLPGMDISVPVKYVCSGECVITYQVEWFDRFKQFEFLILREDSTKKQFNKWLKNLQANKKYIKKLKITYGKYPN